MGAGEEERKSRISISAKSKSRLNVRLSHASYRKKSYGFGSVPGLRPVERTSQVGENFRRPTAVWMNTYQLETRKRFHEPDVTNIVNEVLDDLFKNHKYSAQESPALSLRIAAEVMRKAKALEFNRYRLISVVTLAQRRSQSYNNVVTFLWDHERDSYVNVVREVPTAFCQVTIFGIYLD